MSLITVLIKPWVVRSVRVMTWIELRSMLVTSCVDKDVERLKDVVLGDLELEVGKPPPPATGGRPSKLEEVDVAVGRVGRTEMTGGTMLFPPVLLPDVLLPCKETEEETIWLEVGKTKETGPVGIWLTAVLSAPFELILVLEAKVGSAEEPGPMEIWLVVPASIRIGYSAGSQSRKC